MELASTFFQNFFTEYDSSLSLPLERDPLGFQPIWTSLGNKIFSGVTTSVANDIRNYTINLIHHAVVYKLKHERSDFWSSLTKSAHFENPNVKVESEIQSRLIILLEMMLGFSAVVGNWENVSGILGISSARKRWLKGDNFENDVRLDLKKSPKDPDGKNYSGFVTLLVRQVGLGINGRYKSPLRNMNLLDEVGGYSNLSNFYENERYEHLFEYSKLIDVLVDTVYEAKSQGFVFELSKLAKYIRLYKEAFDKRPAISHRTKIFWLAKMKISEGSPAKALYDALEAIRADSILEKARLAFQSNKNIEDIARVCEVEPFLVIVELLFATLLQEKEGDQIWLSKRLQETASKISLQKEDHVRLKELLDIASNEASRIPSALIEYHKKIASERQIHPWIQEEGNDLKVFKKNFFSEGLSENLNKIKDDAREISWHRDYYLSSINDIQNGFMQDAIS